MKLTEITTVEDLLIEYPLIQEIPVLTVPHQEFLIGCLQGNFVCYRLEEDDTTIGIAIIEYQGKNAHYVAVYAPQLGKVITDALKEEFKKRGCETMTAITKIDKENLYGMEKLYTTYGGKIDG